MSNVVFVSITKWDEFNYREDRKNYSWFKFSNDYFTDDKTLGWSVGAKIVFIYLLCARSKTDSEVVLVNVDKLAFCLKYTVEESLIHIEELELHAVLRRHDGAVKPSSRHVEERRRDKKREDGGGKPKSKNQQTEQHPIVKAWKANRGTLGDVRGVSANRLKHINARWEDSPSEEIWNQIVTRIAASPFCNGENDRNWKADFDFLIKPDTADKVLEGKYDPRGKSVSRKRDYSSDEIKAINEGRDACV